jgi:hypothetical protein
MLINDNPFAQSLADKRPVRDPGEFLRRIDETLNVPAGDGLVEIPQYAFEPLEVRLARSLHEDQIDIAPRALTPRGQGTEEDRLFDAVALKNRSRFPGDLTCVDVSRSLLLA